MTQREKVLMCLVAVALAAAAADSGWSWWRARNAGGLFASASVRMDAERAVSQTSSAMAGAMLRRGQLETLRQAGRPVETDALRMTEGAVRLAQAAARPRADLAYTGYLAIGKVSVAVISGNEYSVGDTVPETGETVRAITAKEVVLFSRQTQAERRLAYSGDDF